MTLLPQIFRGIHDKTRQGAYQYQGYRLASVKNRALILGPAPIHTTQQTPSQPKAGLVA